MSRTSRRWVCLLPVLFATWVRGQGGLTATAPATAPPANLAALRERIEAQIAQPQYAAAQWGIHIASLDTGATLYGHNADKLFLPASTAKLFTAALALDRLGPDFRIRTSVYARSRPDAAGRVQGPLLLFGRGDPMKLDATPAGDTNQVFAPLAEALVRAGLKTVEGDVVADTSYFRGPPFGADWEWDDLQYYYGAEVSALTLNDNTFELSVAPGERVGAPARVSVRPPLSSLSISNRVVTVAEGGRREVRIYRPLGSEVVIVSGQVPLRAAAETESLSLPHPAIWVGALFREALRRSGVRIDGGVKAVDWQDRESDPLDPGRWVELGAIESPPLQDVLARMLKPSQNLYAELLLWQVGETERARRKTASTAALPLGPTPVEADTSEAAGLQAMAAFLEETGIRRGEALLAEGSGLSRHDLVTPIAATKLLRFMNRHRHVELFRSALPLAGVDGTLRGRMLDTPAARNARAKTGSMSYVNALAGYVTSAAGEHLVFAIFLNNYGRQAGSRSASADLDEIVATLAGLGWATQ